MRENFAEVDFRSNAREYLICPQSILMPSLASICIFIVQQSKALPSSELVFSRNVMPFGLWPYNEDRHTYKVTLACFM